MRQGHRVRNPSFGVNLKQLLSPLRVGPHRLHPPLSSEKDVLIPEERSTSAAQFASASPPTRGFAQISARQRPQPASLGARFLPAAQAALAHGSLPREVSPRPDPPAQRCRRPHGLSLSLLLPPCVLPAVPAAVGARFGQAAPRRAPPGTPSLHQKIQIQQRQGAKEGESGAQAEPAAPRPHRFAASPSGTARPIVFQTPKFNGIIMSMGPEWWGALPGRGAVPGRPGLGERGLGPPGSPGPGAAAGCCGAVALRRAIRGAGSRETWRT